MDNMLARRIRERAYEIWSEAGRPEGHAEQHWLIAERELRATLMTDPPRPPTGGRKPRSRATPTTAKPEARARAH